MGNATVELPRLVIDGITYGTPFPAPAGSPYPLNAWVAVVDDPQCDDGPFLTRVDSSIVNAFFDALVDDWDDTVASEPTTDRITLDVSVCDQRRGYRVTFEGPDAEDKALSFINARSATHAFHEVESAPFSYDAFPRLYDLLYPTCEHGLSAWLCDGPGHYGCA